MSCLFFISFLIIARHSTLVSTLAPVMARVSDETTGVFLAFTVIGKCRYFCKGVESFLPSEGAMCGIEVSGKTFASGSFGEVATWEDESSPTAKVDGEVVASVVQEMEGDMTACAACGEGMHGDAMASGGEIEKMVAVRE